MFDLTFLNAELERASRTVVSRERLVDTLMLARRKHPGGSNRLDDLCQRYKVDNSRRTKHDHRLRGSGPGPRRRWRALHQAAQSRVSQLLQQG